MRYDKFCLGLLTIGLIVIMWIEVTSQAFSKEDIVGKTFAQYPTLPKFEEYVTDNFEWKYKGYYLSNKPKTPEETIKDKGGVCGDYAFLYKEYLKRTYNIDVTIIAFSYYKKSGGTGLHAVGLFHYNGVYWVTENWRILRTKVPEDYSIEEFMNAYDIAWRYFKMYHESGSLTDKIENDKDKKELKKIAKHPNKEYRIPYRERYDNGDFINEESL